VRSWSHVGDRIAALWDRRGALLTMAVVTACVVAPQLAYYKWVTNQWIVNPYALNGMGFTFATPHLFGVLFSTQRGLFFWSPVLLMSIAGMVVARDWSLDVLRSAAMVLVLNAWLIASWME